MPAGTLTVIAPNGEPIVPAISDERLAWVLSKVRPLLRFRIKLDPRESYIVTDEPSETGALCEIRYSGNARDPECYSRFERGHEVQPDTCVDRRIVYHPTGFYEMFNPTFADVFAQTPDSVIDQADAFELMYFRDKRAVVWPGGKHHWSVALFYKLH